VKLRIGRSVLGHRLRSAPPLDEIFMRMAGRPNVVYLASPSGFGRLSRWSILACEPRMTLVWRQGQAHVSGVSLPPAALDNPFASLRAFLKESRACAGKATVHSGLAIGYLAYDLKRYVEKLPEKAARDSLLPEMYFGLYRAAIIHDNQTGETFVTGPRAGEAPEIERLKSIALEDPVAEEVSVPPRALEPLRSNFTREAYLEAVRKARKYIYDGDIFQVNLSQRFETRIEGSPVALFVRLMKVNPAPFAAYIGLEGGCAVLSSSPERFLKVEGDYVETRPIKGTRRRTGEPVKDRAAQEDLLSSPKDNAELAMIVDLERNDLGRVADYGTVKVAEPRVLEAYPTVFHLVSTVTARLHPDKDLVDLLKATFPGGSITGAPKVRAMEIIDELEPTRRSVYTGAIGYIGLDGRMDLNIAIRTILYERGRVTFQVGGGIVADSSPEAEYEETLDKGRALARSLGLEL